jgi:two-component system nitrate/nitrite response regulator NarL
VSGAALRLVVADSHRLLHAVLERVLAREGFEIVAFACRGSELPPLVHRHAPDAVVLELDLPELDGLAALRRLAKQFPEIPAIVLAASASQADVTAAFEAGAKGFIRKTVELDHLGATLRQALDGPLDVVGHIAASRPLRILTDREIEVLRVVAHGCPNKEIAARLSCSERTVKFHLTSIYRKLDVKNRTGAVAAAVDAGVIDGRSTATPGTLVASRPR